MIYKILDYIAIFLIGFIVINIMIFWWDHDFLTGMEIFKRLWLDYIILFICSVYISVRHN
jgi:hypothetical protein